MPVIRLSLLCIVLAAARPAAASTASACWDRDIERLDYFGNPPDDGDVSFFTAVQNKGNVTVVFPSTASMKEFPLSLYEIRQKGGAGCDNAFLNGLSYFAPSRSASLSGAYSSSRKYPDPQTTYLGNAGRAVADGLGNQSSHAFRYNLWPAPGGSGSAQTSSAACLAAGGATRQAACQACVDSKGYWLNPGVSDDDTTASAGVFSVNWLRFYPPKANLLLFAYKSLVLGPLLQPLRLAHLASASSGQGASLVVEYLPNSCQGGGRPDNQMLRAVNDLTFNSATNPIAESLFNAGYYNSDGAWNPRFFNNNSVKWNQRDPKYPCPGCQQRFVVLFSDGRGDEGNPRCTRKTLLGIPMPLTAPCQKEAKCATLGMGEEGDGEHYVAPSFADSIAGPGKRRTPGGTCEMDFADDVARWMHEENIGTGQPGSSLTTFVIGIGSNTYGRMNTLKAVGEVGGGMYVEATNFEELEAASTEVFSKIIERSLSFSSAAITTVQTRGSTYAFIPRFRPLQGANWEGKLFRFNLFNEFAAGCTPADHGKKTAYNPDGNDSCNEVYLRDADGDFIGEDGDGNFVKLDTSRPHTPPPALTPWPLRDPPEPATPLWEAADALSARVEAINGGSSSDARTIFTVYDSDDDGDYDARLDLTEANAALLTPLLALGGVNGEFCQGLAARTGSTYAAVDDCTVDVIRFLHGHDVMGQNPDNQVDPPPNPLKARPNILGDIFHSSPILVTPPVPTYLCDLGVGTQCLASLYESTLTPGGPDAWNAYSQAHRHRSQLVLVGANDGMLHAFNAGNDQTGDDPNTTAQEPSTHHYFDQGTGREQWAFIPPGILPKLQHYVLDTRHELFVDGTPMVRDVWVDGSGDTVGRDGVKQADEFHTVAIIAERSGGRGYSALDITDPQAPKFLWSWPPPGSTWALEAGQSWNDHAPVPAPIGPVALKDEDGPLQVKGVQAREQYILAVGGGFDPDLLRGRSIALLDVWTGKPVYRFSASDQSPPDRRGQLFPVAATPTMFDTDQNYLFDTLVVGDVAGQVWTLALGRPGEDTNGDGRVDDWYGGRAFIQYKGDKIAKRTPFFQLASGVFDPMTQLLRVFLGSGDRNHVRSLSAEASCGPGDLSACLRKDCSVSVQAAGYEVGSQEASGGWSGTAGQSTLSSTLTRDSASDAVSCADPATSEITYTVNCSGTTKTWASTIECDWGATTEGVECPVLAGKPTGERHASTMAAAAPSAFYGFRVFGSTDVDKPRAVFATAEGANAYDDGALTDADLANADSTLAGASGNGWYVRYTGRNDEKTSASALVFNGCVLWNTLEPKNQEISCGVIPKDDARSYRAHALTGGTSCGSIVTGARSTTYSAIVPPPMATPVVAINPVTSEVRYSGVSLEPGQPPTQITVGEGDLLGVINWLEVPREVHECRHEGVCQ